MNNIHDLANNLATALKETEELKNYKKATPAVEGNEENKKMIDDFRRLQFEAYNEQVSTGTVSPETEEKFKNLTAVLSMNPSIKEYLDAEARFSVLWEDIMKILSEAVKK